MDQLTISHTTRGYTYIDNIHLLWPNPKSRKLNIKNLEHYLGMQINEENGTILKIRGRIKLIDFKRAIGDIQTFNF